MTPDTGGHRLAWSPAALPPSPRLGTPAPGLQGASPGAGDSDEQIELHTDLAVGHTPAGRLRVPRVNAVCVIVVCV